MNCAHVEQLVQTWKRRLRLDRWSIRVRWETLDGAAAETTWDDMYDYATIRFNPADLNGRDDAYIERTVIHELLHLHDRDRKLMLAQIETCVSPDVYRIFDRIVYQQTEGLIDRLATCFHEVAHEQAAA